MQPIRRILGYTMAALLVVVPPAIAEMQVSARVDRNMVAPGESLQLMVTIKGGDGDVDTGAITDFNIVSQGTSTNMQFINGHTSHEVTYSYMLIPLHSGELTIPALTVRAEGRNFLTDPITIRVGDQPSVTDTHHQDVWVEAALSETNPYVGQQITYTLRLYNAVQIAQANFQPPAFQGFSAKEVKDRNAYSKIINGREFRVTEVNYVLTPLEAGPNTIDPAQLQADIVSQAHRRWRSPMDRFFNDPFFNRGQVERRMFQTEPLKVQIRPLPPYTGSGDFSGLVGHFELQASLEKTKLKVDDATTLTVTVQGRGNIMDAQAPALAVPPTFKRYADNPEEIVELDASGHHGKKIFRTALVPTQPGTFDLSPVQLTYFDVKHNDYRTLSSMAMSLKVDPGTTTLAGPATITPAAPTASKKKVEFTGHDILPPKEGLDALQSQPPLALWAVLLWLLGPLAPYGGLRLILRLRHQGLSPSARMKVKAQRALKAASGGQDAQMLTHLYQALTAAIFALNGRVGEALTWKEAEALLLQCGRKPQIAREAAALLERIESAKFSGAALAQGQRQELLDNTRSMIRTLTP